MSLKIRLISDDPKLLDTAETAIRTVLDVPEDTYRRLGRHRRSSGDPRVRLRYMEATGMRDEWGLPPAPLARAEEAKRNRDLVGEIAELVGADEALARQPWYPVQPGDVVLLHLAASEHTPAYGQTFIAVDDPLQTDVAGNAGLREISHTSLLDEAAAAAADVPKYLLFHNPDAGHWCIWIDDCSGPQLWAAATRMTDPADADAAQQWAEREINSLQGESVAAWTKSEAAAGGYIAQLAEPDQVVSHEWLTPFYDLWFEAGPAGLVVIRAGAIVHGTPAKEVADQ